MLQLGGDYYVDVYYYELMITIVARLLLLRLLNADASQQMNNRSIHALNRSYIQEMQLFYVCGVNNINNYK